MTGPIDAVAGIHNAFRHDIELIDTAALECGPGQPGLDADWSSASDSSTRCSSGTPTARTRVILPLLESVAPTVYATYERTTARSTRRSEAEPSTSRCMTRSRRPERRGLQVPPRSAPRQGGHAHVPPHQRARLTPRAGPGRSARWRHTPRRSGSPKWWRGCSRSSVTTTA